MMPRMRRFAPILALALAVLAVAGLPALPALQAAAQSASTLPLATIVGKVNERYDGKLVDAEVKPAKKHERAAVVYELRLLTPRGAVLKIRVDAATGAFLEIDGRGQLDALRPKP